MTYKNFLLIVCLAILCTASLTYAGTKFGDIKDIAIVTPIPGCDYQKLIGKSIKDIDLSSFKTPVRVLYPDSIMTKDYRAERINLILEKSTDIIIDVNCG